MGFMDGISPVSTQFLGTNAAGAEGDKTEVDSYKVLFENGVSAYYHICKKGWQPSTAIIMCKKTTYVYKIDSSKVYEAMLKQVCNYFDGKENKLASVKSMGDSVRIMLAGRKSRLNGGKAENIYEVTEKDGGFDGLVFYNGYKAQNGY